MVCFVFRTLNPSFPSDHTPFVTRYPYPREETTRAILTRALKLCPQLAPPEVRANREPTIDDVLSHVVGEGCGLRPGRKGGIRMESEWWGHDGKLFNNAKEKAGEGESGEGKVLVVYNYGCVILFFFRAPFWLVLMLGVDMEGMAIRLRGVVRGRLRICWRKG